MALVQHAGIIGYSLPGYRTECRLLSRVAFLLILHMLGLIHILILSTTSNKKTSKSVGVQEGKKEERPRNRSKTSLPRGQPRLSLLSLSLPLHPPPNPPKASFYHLHQSPQILLIFKRDENLFFSKIASFLDEMGLLGQKHCCLNSFPEGGN